MMSEAASSPIVEGKHYEAARSGEAGKPLPPAFSIPSASEHQKNGDIKSTSTASTPAVPLYAHAQIPINPRQEEQKRKETEENSHGSPTLEYERIMQCQASQLRSDLSYACVIPAILLISIAGKPGLLSLSFGGVATYLLDLLESVEGSLISLGLTFLAFTACVVWGIRELLVTSVLNILVFLVMGSSILLIFLTLISQYNVILFDVGIFNNMMLQIMFASMPLIFSTLIAGIVSIEAPEFDIITTFNVVYFIYTYLLCRPRLLWQGGSVQNGFRITRERKAKSKPLLSDQLMRGLLIIPILISVAVHYAIHRRLPMTESNRWFHFAYAVLLPRFLMSFCVFDHKQRLLEDNRAYHLAEDLFQSITILALGHFLPSHPFFDELKTFCEAEEPVPTRVLNMTGTIIAAAVLTHRRLREIRAQQRNVNLSLDDLGMTNRTVVPTGVASKMQFGFFKLLLDVLIALGTVFAGFLLNINPDVLPMTIFGGIALNELYHIDDWNLPSLFLLAIIGFFTVSISFQAFADSTIAPLTYVMSGLYDLSLQDFSRVTGWLLTIGVLSPSLISFLDKTVIQEMVLPGNSAGTNRVHAGSVFSSVQQAELIQWAHYIYSIIFVGITLLTVFLELMILDQNWESIDLTTDIVYPSEYAFATAGMLIATAFLCYRAKVVGLYAIVIVAVSNALKMLVFFDIDPATIFALILVSLAAIYPFFDQLQLTLQFAEDMDKLEFSAQAYEEAKEDYRTPWQHQISAILGLAVILFSPLGRHISGLFLERLLVGTYVVLWQEVTLSAALWIGYLAMILYVFYPSMQLLRNICLGVSFVLVLLACDAFGVLVLDSESGLLHPIDASHSFLMRGNSPFYVVLSMALTAATMTEYVSLNSFVYCALYSVVFGFVATKGIIDWAFPLTLRTATFTTENGTQHLDLVNRDLYYPFYFLFVTKTLWTMVALYSRRDRAESMVFSISYYSSLLLPIVAFVNELYQRQLDMDHVLGREIHSSRMVGIIWSTLLGLLSLAVSMRGREILYFVDGGESLAINDNYNKEKQQPHHLSRKKQDKRLFWERMATKFIKYYYQKPVTAKAAASGLASHLTPLPGSGGRISALFVVVLCGLGWALMTMYFQTTEIDADVLFPAVSLCFLLTLDQTILQKILPTLVRPSAVDIWAMLCIVWWYGSLFYHIFVMHYNERHLGVDGLLVEMQHRRIMQPYSVFGWDTNISLWSNASLFHPILNLALACIPLPGLIFALSPVLFQSASEDILFILGVVNLAALIGAGVDCVRYLAILSAALSIYRSYALAALLHPGSSAAASGGIGQGGIGAAIATAASTFGGSVGPRLAQRDRYL